MKAPISKKLASSVALACAAAFTSTSAHAGEAELQLSNHSVYAEVSSSAANPTLFSAGYLYHDDSRNVMNLDFHAQNQSSFQGNNTHLGLGLKGIGYHEHGADGIGLGLGGFGEIDLSQVPGLSLGAAVHYSPSILTFSDVEDFLWFEAYSGYAVIPNADVQLGYRYIKADIEDYKKHTVEASAFLGIQFHF